MFIFFFCAFVRDLPRLVLLPSTVCLPDFVFFFFLLCFISPRCFFAVRKGRIIRRGPHLAAVSMIQPVFVVFFYLYALPPPPSLVPTTDGMGARVCVRACLCEVVVVVVVDPDSYPSHSSIESTQVH